MADFHLCLIYWILQLSRIYTIMLNTRKKSCWICLCTPSLHFRRRPPQSNWLIYTFHQLNKILFSFEHIHEWYFTFYFKNYLRYSFLNYHLNYTWNEQIQCINTVKVHGVFPSSYKEFRIFTESSISLSQ